MSYKVYPVTKREGDYAGYEVWINGKKIELNTARVSAIPFNRRWPGHQRSLDQTELVNFASLETNEELHFEIMPPQKSDNVKIRPSSLNITPEISPDGKISFTLKKPSYFTVEPYGRHNALHIFADPVKKYDINPNDENVIYYGKGEHDAEIINLKSGQTLFIDEGAVVYACVRAIDAENIKIVGRGILDNSKNKEEILFEANESDNIAAVSNAVRKHTVQLEYCKNIVIEGITLRDSLVYTVKPVACENVDIRNVKIIGNWRYNSDGIDMHNCVGVDICNCFIRTFDDSICIKGFDCYYKEDIEKAVHEAMYRGGKSYDVFKDVHISDCVIWNDWGKCLEIGAETRAEEMCDIVFESCDIIHVTGPALDCENVDFAHVHDAIYRNINIEYDESIPQQIIQKNDSHEYEITDFEVNPYVICVSVLFHHEYSAGGTRRGKNSGIVFENIRLYSNKIPRFFMRGYDEEHKTSDITIKDFYINDVPLKSSQYELTCTNHCERISII